MTLAIETRRLTRTFAGVRAVDALDLRVERGTFSGELIQANRARPVNRRLLIVSPKNTRGGSFLITTSIPSWRHWLCATCSISSRVRLPAVVISSSRKGRPAASWRSLSLPSAQPASSSRAAALAGS